MGRARTYHPPCRDENPAVFRRDKAPFFTVLHVTQSLNSTRYDMLSNALIEAAQRLLMEGKLSHRAIAKKLDVSRGSVTAIETGLLRTHLAKVPDDAPLETGPIERCESCGGRVYMPCRLCRVREWKVERQDETRRRDELRADIAAWRTNPQQPRTSSRVDDSSRRPNGQR
ncbi:MAG: hypothetical protein C0483_15225 [Pirellula sp.]|nr:hypothetical protein [Pirellula sp.]